LLHAAVTLFNIEGGG